MVRGEQVKFEFSSSDASTAAVVTLYDWDQNARTLGARERLLITGLVLVVGSALTVDFFSDKDSDGNVDAGERLIPSGSFAANGGLASMNFADEVACVIGKVPKVKASGAGGVQMVGTGRIIKA